MKSLETSPSITYVHHSFKVMLVCHFGSQPHRFTEDKDRTCLRSKDWMEGSPRRRINVGSLSVHWDRMILVTFMRAANHELLMEVLIKADPLCCLSRASHKIKPSKNERKRTYKRKWASVLERILFGFIAGLKFNTCICQVRTTHLMYFYSERKIHQGLLERLK